jgi:hypothetical protein
LQVVWIVRNARRRRLAAASALASLRESNGRNKKQQRDTGEQPGEWMS